MIDPTQLKALFSYYDQVDYNPPIDLHKIIDQPLSSTACEFEEVESMYNTRFEDLEEITYFYDFSPDGLIEVQDLRSAKYLKDTARGNDNKTVRTRLEELVNAGKTITHIVRSSEVYGGDTHYSVWRSFRHAQIYETAPI
jgi:DNA polymerase III alpha subunit (gram-positive type)